MTPIYSIWYSRSKLGWSKKKQRICRSSVSFYKRSVNCSLFVSFTILDKSIANKTIIEELQKSNLQLEIRNLHDLYPDFKIDVKAEQKALLQHETIVCQYPFFWLGIPAILKQWFDVVFEYQFAYGSQGNKLKDKNFVPSFTVGSPENAYRTLGKHNFRIYEFYKSIEQTAHYAQMNYIEPIYFYGASSTGKYNTEANIKTYAKNHAKKLIERINEIETNKILEKWVF